MHNKKKKIRRVLGSVLCFAIFLGLAAIPLISEKRQSRESSSVSILQGSAESGSLTLRILGGGNITEEEALEVSLPSSVKILSFLTENGAAVSAGDPIARVDRVTVMNAISQVQESLDLLSEELSEASGSGGTEILTARVSGTVKEIYGEEGDLLQEIMPEHGALAVLSLDGRMSVEIEAESDLTSGAELLLTLEDGTEVSGTLESNLDGCLKITLEDAGYSAGQRVSVSRPEGAVLGSGELQINSPWKLGAYSGRITGIPISVGDTVSSGATLMVIENTEESAKTQKLLSQRASYEDLMLELFTLYQTETLNAPCDGVVSGIDEAGAQLLRSQGSPASAVFAVSPGEGSASYTNYVGKVTGATAKGWTLLVNPEPLELTDYTQIPEDATDESLMTDLRLYSFSENTAEEAESLPREEESSGGEQGLPEGISSEEAGQIPEGSSFPETADGSRLPHSDAESASVPLYQYKDGNWISLPLSAVKEGDILIFAGNAEEGTVFLVRIREGESEETSDFPSGGESSFPSQMTWGSAPAAEDSEAAALYSQSHTAIASVTPQDRMELEISVDESDISALSPGMEAEIRIDALGGEKFPAEITDIGNQGSSNGGSSKFTVTLGWERVENMLPGMTATVSIPTESLEDVLLIPVAALSDEDGSSLVYTGYDKEEESLLNPVSVTLGASDGENVQILSGLTAGDIFYYAYYDTPEESNLPEQNARGGFFSMGGIPGGRG